MAECQWDLSFSDCSHLKIQLEPYPLDLRTPFGTSHSSTSQRKNALITITLGEITGNGEIGLPPKKAYCYLADYEDILDWIRHYLTLISQKIAQEEHLACAYDPFSNVPQDYFKCLRSQQTSATGIETMLRFLFLCLDEHPQSKERIGNWPKSGMECALFDLWGKHRRQPVFEIIGVPYTQKKPSFYTAALNVDISKMIEATRFGKDFSDYIKIKLDGDIQRGIEIFNALDREFPSANGTRRWSIDANAAWTPEGSIQFLNALTADQKSRIFMLEQAFPVTLLKGDEIPPSERQKWIDVKTSYQECGISVFADESVSVDADVEILRPYVDGVNIKMEKSGGFRGAVRALDAARHFNLKTWIGTMVGSVLLSQSAANLFPMVDSGGDMDGQLLTTIESQRFEGGFLWSMEHGVRGMVELDATKYGLGVETKR
eukprot:TRINITY_DN8657_c0_g1_i1.p1 TRINITY_DN8657_c0_g1~~TRINITY_DN8657_c0_g1_i1.p1  ORF type:complete len:431 (+),score=108.58 TRINITY_DN8657_c0_g1_i1:26-1318(+)